MFGYIFTLLVTPRSGLVTTRCMKRMHLLQIAVAVTRQQKKAHAFSALQTITLDPFYGHFFLGYQRQTLEIDWNFLPYGVAGMLTHKRPQLFHPGIALDLRLFGRPLIPWV